MEITKQHLLEEIKRTAASNGGAPLGWQRFSQETGIRESDWRGKHWARWGDAIQEAGFAPNRMNSGYDESFLIEKFIELSRELGRLPVYIELRMKARNDKSFPSHTTYSRFGTKTQLIDAVMKYCLTRRGYDDVVSICNSASTEPPQQTEVEDAGVEEQIGFVYNGLCL